MKRRDVLGMAAIMATSAPFWPVRAFAQPASPAMQTLSNYMSTAATRALPADVDEQAKHHLLDTIASIISGSELAPGQAAQRYIRAFGGKGPVSVLGTTLTASATDAALANGVMAHADETDDSHNASRSHPGAGVVPAALAAAEQLGCDGAMLLRAVALGYDVGTRVIMAMGGFNFSYESSHAAHSIMSVFGGAAAAGAIAKLNPQQMRWMLDYTAQQSSGLVAWRRDIDHIQKAFVFSGMGARSGITAALLVHAGWNAVDDIFTGDDNFFQAYAPKADREKLIEKLGERYEIALTDIKKWTVGSPIQAPLDAVDLILRKRPFDTKDVRRAEVRLAPASAVVVDNREMPDICLQHMVAVMLMDKTASFHAAHDKPRMQDPATLHERAKVALVHDDELTKLLPTRVAIVNIDLADGSRLTERVSAVRGTVRNPMSRSEVIDKARDLLAPILGRDKAERLIDTVYKIEAVTDVRNLRPLFQPG